jgi:polysaccharide biosynthesis protein PslH
MKILFLTQICPYPPHNGGAIKTYNILKHLGSRHDVDLLLYVRGDDEVYALKELSRYCRTIGHCPIVRSGPDNLASAVKSLVGGRSFIITRDWRSRMQAMVVSALSGRPDLVYVDHLQMLQFVPNPAPCPVLLDEHNVEWRIIERFASADGSPARRLFASIEWRKVRSYELSACKRADMVLTVTAHDGDTLISNGVPEGKVFPLPIGVDTDYFRLARLLPESRNILTFGTMSWPPNVDAATHFVKSIYPGVKRRAPDARFTIVGANPTPEVRALAADPSITVTGYVDDVRPYAVDAAAFVVPLRIGSGMRVKILDAMALGLPVITTSIGCQGISLRDGETALVADSPDRFAESVVRLLLNPADRTRLGSAGRALVESSYSWPTILAKLDRILASSPQFQNR